MQYFRRSELIIQTLDILAEEELYWFKRSHETWLLKGDIDTKFFHRIANGKKGKNTIFALQDGETLVEGDQNLLKLATKYYKELFGPVESHNIPLDPSLWTQDEKVSSDDNEFLTKPFSIEEVKYALFHMECNKAVGPDKIPIEFFQTCWDIIKEYVMEMFGYFYENKNS
jgi:mannosylglycoprotein endo-beta-mannosidase